MSHIKTIELNPPLLADTHIAKCITCIRAHRERIFRIETQLMQDKTIFHNYGHGGAGWTFLFGAVETSIRQFQSIIEQRSISRSTRIAVVGAGCYGLLTAINLANRGYNPIIIAKETENLACYNAAGFFFARPRKSSTSYEREQFLAYGLHSYQTYLDIARSRHSLFNEGVSILPTYYHPDINPEFEQYIATGLMSVPQKVRIDFANGKQHMMMKYETFFINAHIMMQQLQERVRTLSIPITKKEIDHFEDVDESIIFNCAGFGAKQLTHDQRLIPVQGHLIELCNQATNNLQYLINTKIPQLTNKGYIRDELLYFAPKNEGVLGITFKRNVIDEKENEYEFNRLLERARLFFGLK